MQLSVSERIKLIDELASTVPDDLPPTLSAEWISEINRRSDEIDSGEVELHDWSMIREKLMNQYGTNDAD